MASHAGSINCVAFHPTVSSLASGSDDCTIKIWDWELGELELTIKAHTQAVRDLDFGGPKDAILLASCSADLTIKLWNPSDNYKNIRTLNGHEHAVTSIRFVPSSTPGKNLLISASADKTMRLWDTNTGFCVKILQGHSNWVRSVCPSSDGQFILSSSADCTASLWDTHSPNPQAIVTLIGHDNAVNCCDFAPVSSYHYLSSMAEANEVPSSSDNTAFFATGSRDKTIKLWDTNGNCFATLLGHNNWVSGLVFHPGGRYIFSASDDKTLRVWDLSQKGQCVNVIRDVHGGFITSLRWIPTIRQNQDGAQFRCVIATGSMDKKVRVFHS